MPAQPLYEHELAVERVRAARERSTTSGTGVVLTARAEGFLVGDPGAARGGVNRLAAFAEAGADCLFAPGVATARRHRGDRRAVAPKPVNVLVRRRPG